MDTEERLKYLRELVKASNGQITDQIKQEIIELTRDREGKKNTELKRAASTLVGSSQILEGLSSVQVPDVVTQKIEETMNNSLNSVRMSFFQEIEKYVDCISNDVTLDREVPRVVSKSEVLKIQDGEFIKAFPDASPQETIINPEFKQMIVGGYKPSDVQEYLDALKEENPTVFKEDGKEPTQGDIESANPLSNFFIGIKKPLIGTPESDYLKNYIGADNPGTRKEIIPTNVKNYGGLLKDSFNLMDKEVTVDITENSLIIDISSSLKTNIQSKKFLPFSIPNPSWRINYVETGNRYILNIKNNIKYSSTSGLMPETSSYRFSGLIPESSLNESSRQLLSRLNLGDDVCDTQKNDDIFAALFVNKLDGKIKDNYRNLSTNEKREFTSYLKQTQIELFDSFIQQIFSSINNNRLLEKINLSRNDTFGSQNNVIILNLINFIPEPNEDLIECGKSPHPLNLDEVKRIMSKKFSEVGMSMTPSETIQDEKNPIFESVMLGSTLLSIRLFVVEYVLKNLIVFDEFNYSSTLYKGPIIKEYVSIMAKKEMIQMGIYDSVEKVISENYQFLISNGIIKNEDIATSQDEEDFTVVVDKASFKRPSLKFKTLVNCMLRKTINYVKNVIGLDENIIGGDLLLTNKVYDCFSSNNYSTDPEEKNSFLDMKRMADFKDYDQFLMLEKYIVTPKINRALTSNAAVKNVISEEISKFGCNVEGGNITSILEYSKFLHKIINNWGNTVTRNQKINNLNQLKNLFDSSNGSKIGIRLNYVLKQDKIRPIRISQDLATLDRNELFSSAQLQSAIELAKAGQLDFARQTRERFAQQTSANGETTNTSNDSNKLSRTQQIKKLEDEYNRLQDERDPLTNENAYSYLQDTNLIKLFKPRPSDGKPGTTIETYRIALEIPDGSTTSTNSPLYKDTKSELTFKIYRSQGGSYAVPSPAIQKRDFKPFFVDTWILQNKEQLPEDASKQSPRTTGTTKPYDFSNASPNINTTSKEVFYSYSEQRYYVIDSVNGAPPPTLYYSQIQKERLRLIQERDLYGEYGVADVEEVETQNITPFDKEEYSSIMNENKGKFFLNSDGSIKVDVYEKFINSKRLYSFFDDNEDGIDYFNSIDIANHEVEITLEEIFTNFNNNITVNDIYSNIMNVYESKRKSILDSLKEKDAYQLIVNKSMAIDKITNLLSVHSTSALSNEKMENLFKYTKKSILELMNMALNIDNYGYKSDNEKRGGDVLAHYRDSQNLGNPNYGSAAASYDIAKFLITTPILILKGLAELTDPNIAIASQIVNAAGLGLLFPKLDERGNVVGYPGDPFLLPTVAASMALLPVNLMPPGLGIGPPVTPLGIYFWILEPILWSFSPFMQNMFSKSEDARSLSDDPKYKGIKIGGNFSCDKDQDDI